MEPRPEILLHICCGPCATWPIRILSQNYRVTAFFYNPNLYPSREHDLRLAEAETYLVARDIPFISRSPDHTGWISLTRDHADEPEGGERCRICFRERLEATAREAVARNINGFTTTLTTGPSKPARVIFPIGREIADRHGLSFIEIDFKKKDGFKHSCRLSREAGMYRQDYCGCEYSLRDRKRYLQMKQAALTPKASSR